MSIISSAHKQAVCSSIQLNVSPANICLFHGKFAKKPRIHQNKASSQHTWQSSRRQCQKPAAQARPPAKQTHAASPKKPRPGEPPHLEASQADTLLTAPSAQPGGEQSSTTGPGGGSPRTLKGFGGNTTYQPKSPMHARQSGQIWTQNTEKQGKTQGRKLLSWLRDEGHCCPLLMSPLLPSGCVSSLGYTQPCFGPATIRAAQNTRGKQI